MVSRLINRRMLDMSMLAIAVFAMSAVAQGAVVVRWQGDSAAETQRVEGDDLFADFNEASGAAPADEKIPTPDQNEVNRPLAGGATGTTSTTSSASQSGSSSASLNSLASAPPNATPVGWITGEARFALPNPPGNELLRPPQAV